MKKLFTGKWLAACLISCLLAMNTLGQTAPLEERIGITTITPSVTTGQDFSPWLTDDVNILVQKLWMPINFQYIDVTLTLAKSTNISRLSLYDHEGVFTGTPVSIYALNGTQRTLLGTFTGDLYMQWVDINVPTPVAATAIVVHKYCNDIPQKIKVFGVASGGGTPAPVLTQAVISFGALASKTVGDAAFALTATSNNTGTPITYTSSNPAVATVSNASGAWKATVVGVGTTTITASQAASSTYLAAAGVAQTLTVAAAPPTAPVLTQAVISFGALPAKTVGDAAFNLAATSNNTGTPITYTSSNAAVATVSNASGSWKATVTGAGTTTITASQAAGGTYLAAANVAQPLTVVAAPVVTPPTSPGSTFPTSTQQPIKLRQEFGINAFEWDLEDPNRPWEVDANRLAAVKNFTAIRHYLDWERLELAEGQYTFNPTHSGGWNYDAMYQTLKAEGIDVLACIKTLPQWLLNTWPASQRDHENVPVRGGADFNLPSSYIEQARMGFQFAARYGSNTGVNPALVKVNSATRWPGDGVNQVKIGLNLIKYIECENERDKWWKGAKAYQSPAQYAANLSAFYDGHKGTMGAGVGVKNADPNMQVVMAGLASPDHNYVRGMIDWCRQNRGYNADGSVNLCWDVINYHLYSNDARSSQNGNSTRGAAPEVSEAGQVARDFVQMARQVGNNQPVWITETGYDLHQGSPLKAIAIGGRSILETQADWILRTALMYARLGVERTMFYQLYDDNPTSPIQFGSMGFLNSDRSARPAAQFLRQTNALLGEYTFKQTLNVDPIVDRYELNGNSAYALLVPDETGRTAQYTLNLGSATYADVYRPAIGSQNMSVQRVNLTNGQLALTVTETPLFVIANGTGPVITPPTTTSCSATGTILREQWNNVSGLYVANIPVNTAPGSSSQLTQLESSLNIGDKYGARIRGYLCAPETGPYTFRISGDDYCELWLSTDANPANKVKIAEVAGWTNWRDWTKYPTQTSAQISLTAGQSYYVEVLHKEHDGGDFVSVSWQLPNGTTEGPIPGRRLSPYVAGNSARGTAAGNGSTATATGGSQSEARVSSSASEAVKKAIGLSAAPNPFTRETQVQFRAVQAGAASLVLYDLQGRPVRQVFAGDVAEGALTTATVQADGLAAGVYLLRLTTAGQVLNQRVVLAK